MSLYTDISLRLLRLLLRLLLLRSLKSSATAGDGPAADPAVLGLLLPPSIAALARVGAAHKLETCLRTELADDDVPLLLVENPAAELRLREGFL